MLLEGEFNVLIEMKFFVIKNLLLKSKISFILLFGMGNNVVDMKLSVFILSWNDLVNLNVFIVVK